MRRTNLKLFSTVSVDPMHLSHRVVLAPLMRLRSKPDNSPSAMMVELTQHVRDAFRGGDERAYIDFPALAA